MGMFMQVAVKSLIREAFVLAGAILAAASTASAQARPVAAAESCYVTGTGRHFHDNEFTRYSAKSAWGGSIGLGCNLFDIKGLPLGMGLILGTFAETVHISPIQRQSGLTGDVLTKHLGTMGFVGGTAELKLPAIGGVTPSVLLRYGVEVGSLILPRGEYVDGAGEKWSFAKRYTQEVGLAGCLDYQKAVKLCAEYAKMTYDTYPHSWIDRDGREQGRAGAITAANQISGRIVVPFSAFRM
jgi:hypothetical protein